MTAERPLFGIEKAASSSIAFSSLVPEFLTDYYLYCLDVLHQALLRTGRPLNVMFNNHHTRFEDDHPILTAYMQCEHTLAKPCGIEAPSGGIPVPGRAENYLVRLAKYDQLREADLIFEYSRANIANLESAGIFDDYLQRVAYVSPWLYGLHLQDGPRDIALLTLGHESPRRTAFSDQARAIGLPLTQLQGIFAHDQVAATYRNTRILINIRQTDIFDTLEELRVLPALLSGAVIVSEDVPLREEVPYHPFIVWAKYEDMLETVRDVHENHAEYRRKLLHDPRLSELLLMMRETNVANVVTILERAAAKLDLRAGTPPR